jgi:hypothetical protein
MIIQIQSPKPEAVHVQQARVVFTARRERVLDFDIENRPLSYLGSDFTTGEVTAISWAWTDRPEDVTVHLLGDVELPFILSEFLKVYERADVVTGHFVRAHDLPMINGALMEQRLPPLGDKLTHDTKIELMRLKGISKSQESLAAMFALDRPKVQMNQIKWRAANRLTPEGLAYVRERVVGDVQQHIELRAYLVRMGYISPPALWRSKSTQPLSVYTP